MRPCAIAILATVLATAAAQTLTVYKAGSQCSGTPLFTSSGSGCTPFPLLSPYHASLTVDCDDNIVTFTGYPIENCSSANGTFQALSLSGVCSSAIAKQGFVFVVDCPSVPSQFKSAALYFNDPTCNHAPTLATTQRGCTPVPSIGASIWADCLYGIPQLFGFADSQTCDSQNWHKVDTPAGVCTPSGPDNSFGVKVECN